jgi:rod shape-determining protein MreD
MRMFSVWQQGMIVFAIIGLSQLITYWIDSITGSGNWSLLYLLPSAVSALLWPWVFLALRYLRRRFNVN